MKALKRLLKKKNTVEESKSTSTSVSHLREMNGYYIGPILGQGHFGRVRMGVHKETCEKVALKLIVSKTPSIKSEIEALERVSPHENIVRLHLVDHNAKYPKGKNKTEKVVLMVLDLAEGGELYDFLKYAGGFGEVVARTYFRQMISALERCQEMGVVHRDLKLENILLDSKLRLKVADFGLAQVGVFDDVTTMSEYCGTKGYMASEVVELRDYTRKVDIFSAGVILFTLYAGYPPFTTTSVNDDLFKYIVDGNFEKFWKRHEGFKIVDFPKNFQDLLSHMFDYEEVNRLTLSQVKAHNWVNGETLSDDELFNMLSEKKAKADKSRKEAKESEGGSSSRKSSLLSRLDTVDACRDLFFADNVNTKGDQLEISEAEPEVWDDDIGIAVYTRFKSKVGAVVLLSLLKNLIHNQQFKYDLDEEEFEISATVPIPKAIETGGMDAEMMEISFKVYQYEDQDYREVVVRRLEGNAIMFATFFEEFKARLGPEIVII